MKRIVILIVFFILSIFQEIQYCQVQETKGNLLRIDFTKPNIDLSDTLWNWFSRNDSGVTYSTHCSNIFVRDSTTYLLFNSSGEDRYSHYPWINGNLFNTVTGSSCLLFADHPGYDPLDPYYYFRPETRKISEGVWIYFGRRGPAVYLRNDSLYQFQKVNNWSLIHFAGKVNGQDLVVLEGLPYKFSYYLEDLSISPKLKLNNKITIESSPNKINLITGNYYLYQEDMTWVFYLSSFENNKINLIKRLKPEGDIITIPFWLMWRFVNGNLYYIESGKLVKENLDLNTNSFKDKKIVLDNVGSTYCFDNEGNLFANIKNDSLFVFSIKEEKKINSIDIKVVKFSGVPIIDSPYVYLHQITESYTDVKDKKELPADFLLKGNYPNPFNPSTTISFVLPKRERVGIKIFNSLGQLVCELINEERDAGENSIVWNGKNSNGMEAASGIYFYRVQIGKNFVIDKMVLQK